jgi:hypothetical protein
MRSSIAAMSVLVLLGCGESREALPDAARLADAAVSDAAAIDAPLVSQDAGPTCPRVLFQGGQDPVAQGWTLVQSGTVAITTPTPDTTQVQTTTSGSGAHALLVRSGDLVAGAPFAFEVRMKVVAVADHNPYDAAVAILPAFTTPFGSTAQRERMVYVDSAAVGWADDTATAAAAAIDGAFHDYRVVVNAAGEATVSRDGVVLLTRAGMATNGTIAIGDQSNDPGLESTFIVESVTLLCP